MTPVVGATYESENERRTVVKVSKAGVVTFSTAYLTHDFDGPDPSKLIWQPHDQFYKRDGRREWGEWAAWATVVENPSEDACEQHPNR